MTSSDGWGYLVSTLSPAQFRKTLFSEGLLTEAIPKIIHAYVSWLSCVLRIRPRCGCGVSLSKRMSRQQK